MAILAAFALLHAEHHSLGINVADLQRDDLHGSQASAVGNAERRLVLGPRRGLQETQHLFGREHGWQFAWRVGEYEMPRCLRPVECHIEEESERGHSRVDGRWLHTGLGQMQLERAQLFRDRGVGGTAEESREPLDDTDVLALRIRYYVKVFGCRPHGGGAAHAGAGVRKPPREETAGGRAIRSVRRYGDFGARSVARVG